VLQNGHIKNGNNSHTAEIPTFLPTPVNSAGSVSGNYRCYTEQISIETQVEVPSFNDITETIRQAVARADVTTGSVTIYSRHTTASIIINEHEPLLLHDMCERLTRLFPKDEYYRHNDFDIRTHNMNPGETPNGHSHCQHLMLSTSETVPIIEGQMLLGRWQSIFLVELDRPLPRSVVVVVSGI
jgi:secondary thiamine-phosphate synthase enzyme